VVPRLGEHPGTNGYDRWIHDNWRAAVDYKALADTPAFISYMTYAQHRGTKACLEYRLGTRR
jgi:spore germination protein YaaH